MECLSNGTYGRGSYGGLGAPTSVCSSISVRSVPQYVDHNGEEGVVVGGGETL